MASVDLRVRCRRRYACLGVGALTAIIYLVPLQQATAQKATARETSYPTRSNLPHTKQVTAHEISYCTRNKLPDTKQATTHETSYPTVNKLPDTKQATTH